MVEWLNSYLIEPFKPSTIIEIKHRIGIEPPKDDSGYFFSGCG